MKFFITKQIEADNITEAYNKERRGEGEVVEVYKSKEPERKEMRTLNIGFRTEEAPKKLVNR